MKKCLSIILATLLTVSSLAGCSSPKSLDQQNSSSEQKNSIGQSSGPAINRTVLSTNGASSPTVSSNASAAYEKLMAYKTEDYRQQSVADFNAALASTPDELTEFLAAEADVISAISPDDKNYDFLTTTMSFSANELYCEHMGEEFTFFVNLSNQS